MTITLEALLAKATFVAISHATAQELRDRLGVPMEKIEVIYPAASPVFQPMPDDVARRHLEERFGLGDGFILTVGTLEPRKNHRRLLEAWARLPQPLRRAYPLVVVGGKGWKTAALPREFANRADCHLLGEVTENDLIALYNRATVFAYPSLVEGFGLPIVEAMACGAPVLTSNRSSLLEVGGDAARLVEPEDVDAIGAALEELLGSEGLRHRLSERGRQRAKSFSWLQNAQQTLALYHRLQPHSS